MNEYKNDDLTNDVITMLGIEERLSKKEHTQEDINTMLYLADVKEAPRAEFNAGIFYLQGIGVEENRIKAFDYFEKVKTHGAGYLCFQIAMIYALEDPIYVERAMEFMEKAKDDHFKPAIEFLKTFKKEFRKTLRVRNLA
jgi:TPR repeat protein